MALIVGDATVGTKMSGVIEKQLFESEFLIDGLTYTSKYKINDVGEIQILFTGSKKKPENPVTPGSNFNKDYRVYEGYSAYSAKFENSYQKSVKIPEFYNKSMPLDVITNEIKRVTDLCRKSRERSALCYLIYESRVYNRYNIRLDKYNIRQEILGLKMQYMSGYKPNVLLVSTTVYDIILDLNPDDFIPVLKEYTSRQGQIGYWLGLYIVECEDIDWDYGSSFISVIVEGREITRGATAFPMILYSSSSFSVIDKLDGISVIESERFNGNLVQEELSSSFCMMGRNSVVYFTNEMPYL